MVTHTNMRIGSVFVMAGLTVMTGIPAASWLTMPAKAQQASPVGEAKAAGPNAVFFGNRGAKVEPPPRPIPTTVSAGEPEHEVKKRVHRPGFSKAGAAARSGLYSSRD